MRPSILLSLAISLAITSVTAACKPKRSPEQATEVVREQMAQPWNGQLVEALPDNTPTWIYVDISSLRDDPRVLSFFRALTEENREPLTIALLEADELVVGWTSDQKDPLVLLRSSFITPQLRGAIMQGALRNEADLNTEAFGAHSLSVSPTRDAALSSPASNLLFSGSVEALKASLTQLGRINPIAPQSASATSVFAITPSPFWVDIAEEAISEPKFAEQVRAITMISGAMKLDRSLALSARLSLDATGEPEFAAEIFGLAISRVLPQLLVSFFTPEYAVHLTSLIRVSHQPGAVMIHLEMPEKEVTAWLNVLQLLAEDPSTPGEAPSQAPANVEQEAAPIVQTPEAP